MASDEGFTHDKRPKLAIRVGVTGSRELPERELSRLRGQLCEVLGHIRDLIEIHAQVDQAGQAAYSPFEDEHKGVLLRLLSPLAIGADRLAAHEALGLGYRLHVPMPFPKQEYLKDFQEPKHVFGSHKHTDDFERLFAQANGDVLSLDGSRDGERDRGYEAVGRYVVRHADVVIALWDGSRSHGRGGTAEIVEHAVRNGVPVWLLHPTQDRLPRWISDVAELHACQDDAAKPNADCQADNVSASDRLKAYFAMLIPAPAPSQRGQQGFWERVIRLGQPRECRPQAEYFSDEGKPRPVRWRIYRFLMWFFALRDNEPESVPSECLAYPVGEEPPDDTLGNHWYQRYERANSSATGNAGCYRSSYTWIIVLGIIALTSGAFALALSLRHCGPYGDKGCWLAVLSAVFELGSLVVIAVILRRAMRLDWHSHAIEYRVLAEVFRKQQALALLGWSLPVDAVRDLSAVNAPDEQHVDRSAWVAWLFAAEQRAAPLPTGDMSADGRARAGRDAIESLICGQIHYHGSRAKQATTVSRRLEAASSWAFVGVFCIVSCKVLLLLDEAGVSRRAIDPPTGGIRHEFVAVLTYLPNIVSDFDGFMHVLGALWRDFVHGLEENGWWLSVGAAFLSALAAASAAFRSYAELEVLAHQSHHMLTVLGRALRRLQRIDVGRPLATQDIGAEAAIVATQMLRDLEGWATLFRVKGVEPG